MTHVFVDDGTEWLDHIRRCRVPVGEHGEECGLPEHNRAHQVPGVSDEAAHIEARRLGERSDR